MDELDYVEPKTANFKGFPKFWREPNLREWWVGVKENWVSEWQCDRNDGSSGGPRAKKKSEEKQGSERGEKRIWN